MRRSGGGALEKGPARIHQRTARVTVPPSSGNGGGGGGAKAASRGRERGRASASGVRRRERGRRCMAVFCMLVPPYPLSPRAF